MKTLVLIKQSSNFLICSFKRIHFASSAFVILLSLTNLTSFAQENIKRSSRATEAVRVSEEGINFTEYSVTRTDEHFASNELRELNRKANLLLNELRNLLKDAEKEAKFREGIGASIIEKASLVCPSVQLKHLLFGDERTNAVRFEDYEEGKNFISLLSVANNELAQ